MAFEVVKDEPLSPDEAQLKSRRRETARAGPKPRSAAAPDELPDGDREPPAPT